MTQSIVTEGIGDFVVKLLSYARSRGPPRCDLTEKTQIAIGGQNN